MSLIGLKFQVRFDRSSHLGKFKRRCQKVPVKYTKQFLDLATLSFIPLIFNKKKIYHDDHHRTVDIERPCSVWCNQIGTLFNLMLFYFIFNISVVILNVTCILFKTSTSLAITWQNAYLHKIYLTHNSSNFSLFSKWISPLN